MKLVEPRRHTPDETHLLPLINVIFLMLIFFMVMGRITPGEPLEVAPPTTRQGQPTDTEGRILLIAADGRLAIGEEIIEPDALPARLKLWLSALAEGTPASPHMLTVKADAALTTGQLRSTLDTLRAAGVEHLSLLTVKAP